MFISRTQYTFAELIKFKHLKRIIKKKMVYRYLWIYKNQYHGRFHLSKVCYTLHLLRASICIKNTKLITVFYTSTLESNRNIAWCWINNAWLITMGHVWYINCKVLLRWISTSNKCGRIFFCMHLLLIIGTVFNNNRYQSTIQ